MKTIRVVTRAEHACELYERMRDDPSVGSAVPKIREACLAAGPDPEKQDAAETRFPRACDLMCTVCAKRFPNVALIGEDPPDYDLPTVYVCRGCLISAIALLDEAE